MSEHSLHRSVSLCRRLPRAFTAYLHQTDDSVPHAFSGTSSTLQGLLSTLERASTATTGSALALAAQTEVAAGSLDQRRFSVFEALLRTVEPERALAGMNCNYARYVVRIPESLLPR